jgi:hypothetical protein
MSEGERLFAGPDRARDEQVRQKPEATIGCAVCAANRARICGVRLQNGQCTVTYRCGECGHTEARLLP